MYKSEYLKRMMRYHYYHYGLMTFNDRRLSFNPLFRMQRKFVTNSRMWDLSLKNFPNELRVRKPTYPSMTNMTYVRLVANRWRTKSNVRRKNFTSAKLKSLRWQYKSLPSNRIRLQQELMALLQSRVKYLNIKAISLDTIPKSSPHKTTSNVFKQKSRLVVEIQQTLRTRGINLRLSPRMLLRRRKLDPAWLRRSITSTLEECFSKIQVLRRRS